MDLQNDPKNARSSKYIQREFEFYIPSFRCTKYGDIGGDIKTLTKSMDINIYIGYYYFYVVFLYGGDVIEEEMSKKLILITLIREREKKKKGKERKNKLPQ